MDDYRAMTILDEADAGPSVEGPDTRAAGRARAAYAAAGLETHAGKQVVNTVDDTFLGSELADVVARGPRLLQAQRAGEVNTAG